MTDSLLDLLNHQRFEEPPEIAAIKQYIMKEFQTTAEVGLRDQVILITVRSAALANTLRLRLSEVQKAAHTTKKLVLRIV